MSSAGSPPQQSRAPKTRAKRVVSQTTLGNPSDQLAGIKSQWNAERDIPSGTVRNNPFLPKPTPMPGPPPQLKYQKKQWDTKDIPRGAVATRLMIAVCVVMGIIAFLDFLYQKFEKISQTLEPN